MLRSVTHAWITNVWGPVPERGGERTSNLCLSCLTHPRTVPGRKTVPEKQSVGHTENKEPRSKGRQHNEKSRINVSNHKVKIIQFTVGVLAHVGNWESLLSFKHSSDTVRFVFSSKALSLRGRGHVVVTAPFIPSRRLSAVLHMSLYFCRVR